MAFRSHVLRSALIALAAFSGSLPAQTLAMGNAAGVEVKVDAADRDPVLLVSVPDGPSGNRSFKILVPEHVSVREHGQTEAQHLYIYARDPASRSAAWKQNGRSLQYEKDYGDLHFLARATLQDDGILFHYEFTNGGTIDYDMVTAVTDPRFHTVFYDPRLQRTYVHHANGFVLLGAPTPERLTLPLKQWFPVRYLASYTAPIPTELIQRQEDGITYRYSPERVDLPMIATLSEDGTWVAASFSHSPGNVWSNPELTCQHVDEETPLPHGGHTVLEVKILLFAGSLEDALGKVTTQREHLK